jgi:hypothetical protein
MTRKKALERWETKKGNAEVTPQAIWPIAKSLLTRDGPRAPLLFMVLQASNFSNWRKTTQFLTVRKFSSYHIICVTKTMKGRRRIKYKLY